MDWDVIAPMVVAIVLIVTVGGVVLLRPLSARLGKLLDAMAEERREPTVQKDLERVRQTLETLSARLEFVEERQDFTEALLGRDREERRLPAAAGEKDPDAPEA